MFTLINILPIIKRHFQTLNEDTSPLVLVILYFLLPVILSSILVYKGITLNEDLIKVLITAFSIFIGFILNVILIIFDIIKKNNKNRKKVHEDLIEHLYYNSLYAVTISTILIILLIFMYLLYSRLDMYCICALSAISYFILMNFLITLLQITKRIFVLLENES